jgi:uncharacterized protein (DUF1015 family)
VPILRAFRALRYEPANVPDLGAVLCPPYDVISAEEGERLRQRDPRNAIRLELPEPVHSDDDASRYKSAARALAEWRSNGTLRKDRVPTITIHEMRAPMPGAGADGEPTESVSRGFFARLRLEPFGPDAGVRPHERTMSGPKEDRYRLLRATGANLSPVVLLHGGDPARTEELLDRLTARAPDAEAVTSDGVTHRVWIAEGPQPHDDESGTERPEPTGLVADVAALLGVAASHPLTIADGHHRYETAWRYREERGQNRACESDPAWDYVMALVYAIPHAPTVLPTHRLVLDGPSGEALMAAAEPLFHVRRVDSAAELLDRMAADAPDPRTAPGDEGSERFGLWTGGTGAVLRARRDAFEPLLDPGLSEASRNLDVNLLALAIERLVGVDAPALAAGGRLRYTKDAREAIASVDSGEAASAFLLDPTPVAAVTEVAAAGEVMPQKSTYFYPKAPTGLLFAPLEW